MERLRTWFSRGAEFIAAMMLAAIFLTFLIQIFSRYASKLAPYVPIPLISDWMAGIEPIGWTVNLISLLWVWLVFFGCAFVVRERDHVTFDILYLSMPRRGRQVFALVAAAALVAAMVASLPAMWDFVMNNRLVILKKIPTLRMPITGEKIPMQFLFISFLMMMFVVIFRYGWRFVDVLRNGPPDADHELPGHDPEPPHIRHGDDAT